jgi:hypothetical protein
VVSSLVSSVCVRSRSAAFGSVLRGRSRTSVGLGGLASRVLKIGRSVVRPCPLVICSDQGFLWLLVIPTVSEAQ